LDSPFRTAETPRGACYYSRKRTIAVKSRHARRFVQFSTRGNAGRVTIDLAAIEAIADQAFE